MSWLKYKQADLCLIVTLEKKNIANCPMLWFLCDIYQSPLILIELFQHNLMNVSYLTACYLYQVMMTLHFLKDVANDAESTQKNNKKSHNR